MEEAWREGELFGCGCGFGFEWKGVRMLGWIGYDRRELGEEGRGYIARGVAVLTAEQYSISSQILQNLWYKVKLSSIQYLRFAFDHVPLNRRTNPRNKQWSCERSARRSGGRAP